MYCWCAKPGQTCRSSPEKGRSGLLVRVKPKCFGFESSVEKEAETPCAAYVRGPRAGFSVSARTPLSPGTRNLVTAFLCL